MAISKKDYQGVYVEDDIPAFMQTGSNRLMVKNAKQNGILASTDYTLPININPSKHKPRPLDHKDAPPPPAAEPSALWNQGFLLSIICMLIAVNGMLYLIFSDVLGDKKAMRLTLTSTKQEIEQKQSIEDRIITFRDMNDQFKLEYEAQRREELSRARLAIPSTDSAVFIKP